MPKEINRRDIKPEQSIIYLTPQQSQAKNVGFFEKIINWLKNLFK